MSLDELRGTTARRALILGMTDTGQIGMQQARAPAARAATPPAAAEVLPDAGDGGGPEDVGDGDGDGDLDPETGLSAADLEAFRQMESGEPPVVPEGEEPEPGEGGEPEPAEPEPAARTPAEPAAKTPQKVPQTVNFNKHQREIKKARDEAAAATAALEKERTDRIKLDTRLQIINEALAAQAAAAQAAPAVQPDPNAPPENPFDEEDIDPTVDYAASVLQERRRNRYAYDQTQQTQTTIQEDAGDRAMRETFTRDFSAYARTPEGQHLPEAYQFLKDSRLRQICLGEFDKDPLDPAEVFTQAEVKTMVDIFNAEEKWLVGNAIKQRKSPAVAILKQAKIYGFTPKAPAAAAPAAGRAPQVPARTNGARPPAAPAAPAAPSAAAALAELAAAQEAGKSLSEGGGAPPEGITAQLLLDMPDDEFEEMVDSMSKSQLDTLMGRVPT